MQPAALRVASPGEEAGAVVRSSSSESVCLLRVGPRPGRYCVEGCHLRGVHFPWSNNFEKRVLF